MTDFGYWEITDDMQRVYVYEPMPPRVTYEAARNRFVYTPENIVPGTTTTSPSDRVWIVQVSTD